MTDITITAEYFDTLVHALTEIGTLSPPPSPKGRYALAKIASKFTQEHTVYKKSMKDFLDDMVTKDEKGNPVYETIEQNRVKFSIIPEKAEEYLAGIKELEAETITLTNVRPITHEELGNCPITVHQECILLACNILIDEEPK